MTTLLQTPSFALIITLQTSQIYIEAQHEPSGKVFTTTIDDESIAQTTNNLFANIGDMIQGLKDAADLKYPGLSLDLNSQGKLTYRAVLSAGVIKKECSFTLDLTEKELEASETTEKELNSCEQWIENVDAGTLKSLQIQNEKRFEKLENIIRQMEQKMTKQLNTLENLCSARKPFAPLQHEAYFNEASADISKYALSDKNKTATLIAETLPFLELLPQIPTSGQHSYSLRMNGENHGFIFGIQAKGNWNHLKQHYEYLTVRGNISGKVCKDSAENDLFLGKGSVVKMAVDMDQGTLTFFVDNRQINSCHILKSDPYYAFIRLIFVGDSVTLI